MRETVHAPENTEALVSVVMATYNEPPEIVGTAIKSILDQTYDDIELLIYDDSTDSGTIAAIDAFADNRAVRISRSRERRGLARSLNCGLTEAAGELIARMDGDDIAYPDRIEKQVAFLKDHRGVSVVGGQLCVIDNTGTEIGRRRYPPGGVRLSLFSAVRNPLAHPAVMMRRELVDAGFRYDESLRMSEDLDLWLRLMNRGYKLANLREAVLAYRVGDDFAEKRTKRAQIEYMAMVRRRNFNGRYPIRSALSCAAGWMFLHAPVRLIQKAYKSENGQN